MATNTVSMKAYGEKLDGQLKQVASQIENVEGQAKQTMAQAEIDAIRTIKTKKQQIDRKREDLQKAGETAAARIKAEIDTDISGVKTSLEQVATRLKDQAAETARQVASR
jgi:predicted transcriptional regulator